VDVLASVERTTEDRLHDFAMLINFFSAAFVKSSVARRVDVAVFVDRSPAAAFVTAVARIKSLLHVVCANATVLKLKASAIAAFVAELALKSSSRIMVHEGQFILGGTTVKEKF
jgi:hypothetical protein